MHCKVGVEKMQGVARDMSQCRMNRISLNPCFALCVLHVHR